MTRPSPLRAEAQAHRAATVTEREARDRAAVRAGDLRGDVLWLVVEAGERGMTATEALRAYRRQHGTNRGLYSIHPRLSELKTLEYVEIRRARGKPRRAVYVATEAGQAWAQVNR